MDNRAETGVMRFDGDWRGVFIRGDNAFGYAMYLKAVLESSEPESTLKMYSAGLRGLLGLLLSSDERNKDVPTQRMRPYDHCTAEVEK